MKSVKKSGIRSAVYITEQTNGHITPGCVVEQSYARRLFTIMLQGLSSILEKRSMGQRSTWSAVMWATRDLLRVQTAQLLVWLLSPLQPVKMRTFAVHTLRSESRCKELLSSILHTHAQVILKALKCTYSGTSKTYTSWFGQHRTEYFLYVTE
jgi:hypothetical protein